MTQSDDEDTVVRDVWEDIVHNCFIKCEEWKMYPNQDGAVAPAAAAMLLLKPPPPRAVCLHHPTEETREAGPRTRPQEQKPGRMFARPAGPGSGRRQHLPLYVWESVGVYLLGSLGPDPGGCVARRFP